MRNLIVSIAAILLFASATSVAAQERRDGRAVGSPRVSANVSRPARVSGDFRGTRRFGYRARVYGSYDGYGYRSPRRYYRSYGYGPVYGYRGDSCDW